MNESCDDDISRLAIFGDRSNASTSKLSVYVDVGCAVRTMKIPTCWHFGAHGAPYHGTDFT